MPDELTQDSWSLTRPRFGKDKQLEVVGLRYERAKGGKKIYALTCSICLQDTELFSCEYFYSTKGNLSQNKIPCGCSASPSWSKRQWKIIANRKATELGFRFVCLDNDYKGCGTKTYIECPSHGVWNTGSLEGLVYTHLGCPRCAYEMIGKRSLKGDDVMINSFMKTGSFHPDTEFRRSERKTLAGKKLYWEVECPECGEVGESLSSNLQLGQRPCSCSRARQKEAYIHTITIDGELVALKFGIANFTKSRLIQQNRNNSCVNTQLQNYAVFKFESRRACLSAERECKTSLETCVLSSSELPDGWTETVSLSDLENIMLIYLKNGGINIGRLPS